MERINSRLDSINEIEYSGAVAGCSFSGSGPSQAMDVPGFVFMLTMTVPSLTDI